MSKKKWGETFLKTGLPLEHLALTSLTALGWECEPRYEYERPNRKGHPAWFEVDLIAYAPRHKRGALNLLIECKYHDEQRFWFFLPCTTLDHEAQYGALSAGADLESDEEVLHYAPYSPLRAPKRHTLISLAPRSVWGANVSLAGTREENSIHEALEQLGYAFVPFCLDRLYSFCSYSPGAVIPAVVTTAKLFRLRETVTDIRRIRDAAGPGDIADEVPWTWCYYAPRGQLLDHNNRLIDDWKDDHSGLRFAKLDEQLASLWSGPHWVMVTGIEALAHAAKRLHSGFLALPKDFAQNRRLTRAVESYSRIVRQRRGLETAGKRINRPGRKGGSHGVPT